DQNERSPVRKPVAGVSIANLRFLAKANVGPTATPSQTSSFGLLLRCEEIVRLRWFRHRNVAIPVRRTKHKFNHLRKNAVDFPRYVSRILNELKCKIRDHRLKTGKPERNVTTRSQHRRSIERGI